MRPTQVFDLYCCVERF